MRPGVLRGGLQLVASALVLGWLVHDAHHRGVQLDLGALQPGPLVAALAIKALSLCVHELRLWTALPAPRPPATQVFGVGFVAGLANMVLPARAGDAGLIAALASRLRTGWPAATAAVAQITITEVWIFGICCAMALGAAPALPALDADARAQLRLVTLGGAACLAALLVVAAHLRPQAGRWSRWLPAGGPRAVGIDAVMAAVEVGSMIAAFSLGITAAGAQLTAPMATTTLILAASAGAAALLPPAWGAGPAAACALVLGGLGAPGAVVARAALAWWLVSQLPMATLGLWGLLTAPRVAGPTARDAGAPP